MTIEAIKHNWRVEVNYSISGLISPELFDQNVHAATALANYVETLKGICARPVCDVYYRCSNCGSQYDHKEDLLGCCEANLSPEDE